MFGDLGMHGAAALAITLGALMLFTRSRLPIEYSCVVILFVLVLGFELFPYERDGERQLGAGELLAGLGNEALITILLLLILGKGVELSGGLRPLARLLARLWLLNSSAALLATLLTAAVFSAFINNTPIVVMLLPVLVGVTSRLGTPPSGILMPVGFATIVGGMSTTIGTSTNLLVVTVAADYGLERLAMFDFALPAAIAAAVAIPYLWLIAPRLVPERQPPLSRDTPRVFGSVIEVPDYSPIAGRTLGEIRGLVKGNLRIRRVQRGGLELVRLPSLTLRPGDRLFVRGTAEAIKEAQNVFGGGYEEGDILRLPDEILVEVVVTPESPLFEKRLSEAQALLPGSLMPVGIFTPGTRAAASLDDSMDPVLASGDVLLMQGKRQEIRHFQDRHRLLILDRAIHIPRSSNAPTALAIMMGVVAAAALGVMPIIASALCGAALMLFFRCISLEEAWSALDGRLIIVVVTSLALGTALTSTGAAAFLAAEVVALVEGMPAPLVLSGVLLFTALLTEIVTNNAVAVIATPIAIAVAQQLGVAEVAFVLAVLFGANMSYMTPIGYQTNLLVYSAGGYRFSDFLRVGIPLQILLWLTLSIALPLLYL